MTCSGGTALPRAVGGAVSGILAAPAQLAASLAGALSGRAAAPCEIPPPCWEPRPAGSCCLELTPGSTGTVRVKVSNCGWHRQMVEITALGKIAGWMIFTPTTLIVGPQEHATFVVRVHVPDEAKPGRSFSAPIIVHGCNDHFARLELTVAECAQRICCDVEVNDCPDNLHHWYDHFYCPRPCRNSRLEQVRR